MDGLEAEVGVGGRCGRAGEPGLPIFTGGGWRRPGDGEDEKILNGALPGRDKRPTMLLSSLYLPQEARG
jgi:hypothetical protein